MDAATSFSEALQKSLTFEDDAISQSYTQDVEATMHFHELRQKHIVPPRELGVPLRQIYPHDWNAYFEGYDKDLQYGGPGVDLSKYSAKYADTLELGYTSNKPLCEREQRATLEKLVFLQLELIPRVQEMLADGAFVRAWEGMGREEKMDLALKALVRAADVAHERARVDCPEMSLYGLIGERKGDGEQGLVSLFQEMATHDGIEGPMYIFRHPKFEEEIHLMSRGIPDTHWKRAYAGLRVMQRLLFISATLAAILDLHAGIPPSPHWLQDITRVYDTCFQCGIDAAAANLPNLRKCTGCAYALYCSPRCQKQNWAAHKLLCVSTKNIVPIPKPWASLVDAPVTNPDPDEETITFSEYLRLERAALKWH